MHKQDYIEKIATCIAESWLAADAGDQEHASRPNKMPCVPPSKLPTNSAARPAIGLPSPNSEQRTCIRPQFEETLLDKSQRRLFSFQRFT